jgi:sirohydrochlorin ferrochelatase
MLDLDRGEPSRRGRTGLVGWSAIFHAMTCRLGLLVVAHRCDAESASHLQTLVFSAGVQGRLATIGRQPGDEIGAGVRALHAAAHDGVAVVPLFVSSGNWIVRRVTELAVAASADAGIPASVTAALDASAEVMDVLADRARRLAGSPTGQALMLVGHGPVEDEDLASWDSLGAAVAGGVRDRAEFAVVEAGVVRDDAPPDVRAAAVHAVRERIARLASETGRAVVVVPWIVGAGSLTRERLPADLTGLDVRYDGQPLLPHPALARWVTRQLSAARPRLVGASSAPA